MEVPKAISGLRQWICWRYEGADKRKVPRQPNGEFAKSNDPATWYPLDRVVGVPGMSGPGFVFAPAGGLFGIDLDNCVDEHGQIADWATKIIEEFATYAEWSPSGNGIKLWGRGSLGDRGRKTAVGDKLPSGKQPGIEIYDRGRYFTFTGEAFPAFREIADCQKQLDSLVAELWPAPSAKPNNLVATQHTPSPSVVLGDVQARAMAYVATIPGGVAGQRGSDLAYHVAQSLVKGFGLSIEEARPIFESYSSRCSPPWSEREIEHKLVSARDASRMPEGYLLVRENAEVSLEQYLVSACREIAPAVNGSSHAGHPEPPEHEGRFPEECLRPPGLVGLIVEHNLATALYPQPELALAGAVALMGVITGRKVRTKEGMRSNVYVLGLGASGSGKEHARKVNKDILSQSSASAEKMLGPERIASAAGMVASIHEQPAILFQLDEIGRLIQTMQSSSRSPHLFNIASVLMTLYSSANTVWKADAYADQKKNRTIVHPHCCLYGTTTPEQFWHSLTADNVSDGFLGRLLVFEGRPYVPPQRGIESRDPSEEILLRVREWIEYGTTGNLGNQSISAMTLKIDADAQQRLEDHYDAIHQRRVTEEIDRAAIWSRSGEKAVKLAMLFACSRGVEPTITLEDVNLAIRCANWLTRRMARMASEHVSEGATDATKKRILRLLEQPMTMTELCRKTQWIEGGRKARANHLEDLVEAGLVQIEISTVQGAKKPTTILRRTNSQALNFI